MMKKYPKKNKRKEREASQKQNNIQIITVYMYKTNKIISSFLYIYVITNK